MSVEKNSDTGMSAVTVVLIVVVSILTVSLVTVIFIWYKKARVPNRS